MTCLEKCILEIALTATNDMKGDNLSKRITYKQFTWWIHSRLGKGVRKVIPSCVVWFIRKNYPSENVV